MANGDINTNGYTLRVARTAQDFQSFREIVLDFHQFLNVDLSFQNFEEEMAGLPGCYAQPDGAILIASVMTESGSRDAGAVAVRPLPEKAKSWQSIAAAAAAAEDSGTSNAGENGSVGEVSQGWHGRICEMKRLYVRPEFRGLQLGWVLCEELIRLSREMGYDEMVLDTLDRLKSAGRTYEKLGFEHCGPYYHNPHPGVIYWRKSLKD